jgi:Spy/CpxP family protein refolding chaperone
MRVTLSMLGLLLAAGFASAQTPPADSPPAASNAAPQMNRLDRLAILLDLTPEQKTQVQQILQQQRQQMRAFFQQQTASGAKPNFQQMRTERQQLRQQTLTTLQTVLSADQYRKMQVLMTPQFRHHWRHHPGSSGSAASSSGAGQ